MEFPDTYEAKQPPEWATYCPDRRQPFKVHSSKGLAHSAIGYHKPGSEIAMYHLEVEDGGPVWKKAWEFKFPNECPKCGKSCRVYKIPYRYEGTIKDAQVICDSCWYDEYQEYRETQRREADLARLSALRSLYPEA
jgi:hypothetical protein